LVVWATRVGSMGFFMSLAAAHYPFFSGFAVILIYFV
jgi:hypothetical protein